MHAEERQDEAIEMLAAVMGKSVDRCAIQLAEDFRQGFSSLPPEVAAKFHHRHSYEYEGFEEGRRSHR